MALGDNVNPTDDILSRLSQPRAAEEMPRELQCPSGHRAHRVVVEVRLRVGTGEDIHHIPVWVCEKCLVGYRYNECALPSGEEGHP